MSGRYLVRICILALVAAAGCGGPKMVPVPVSETPRRVASAAEMVALVNAGADSIRALKADLDLSFRKGPGEKARTCGGKLLSMRGAPGASASIYLKGYRRLVPTFFTLVSDGAEFWLHVPSRNTVYTGPVNHSGLAHGTAARDSSRGSAGEAADTMVVDLEASDLSRALFVEPIDTALDCRLSLDGDHYALEVLENGVVRRRLNIEQRLLSVDGETYYTREGVKELELSRSKFTVAAGAPYPRHIVIVRPISGKEIVLDIEKLDLAPPQPPPTAFRFTPPNGARIERIE